MLEWKDNTNKKALFIKGSRQIWKTTLVREFGKNNYQNFFEVNFITTPGAKEIYHGDLSADIIIAKLTAFLRKELIVGKTLIFSMKFKNVSRLEQLLSFSLKMDVLIILNQAHYWELSIKM